MHLKLTDLALQKLPEGMHWDEITPAFGVRVGKRAKTFICVRDGGRRVTIGRYPYMSLIEARTKAKGILLGLYERHTATGYQECVERYLRQVQTELKTKTFSEYSRILRSIPFVRIEVTPVEVATCLERMPKASSRAHAYAALKTFFNWAMRNEYVTSNPVTRVRAPRKLSARERVLDDHELVKIWDACHDLGKFGALVRLLMLTGQRKGQFSNLREEWVDEKSKTFIFPATAMKTQREHRLPYAYPTDFILARCGSYKGYYFSPVSALGQLFTAWSKSKDKLDRMIDIDPWTLHDLRRTWSTNAARLEIPPHVTERVLSHVSPEGKVSSIYNRWKYEPEMREAQTKMGKFILTLVQEAGAVDPLHRELHDFE